VGANQLSEAFPLLTTYYAVAVQNYITAILIFLTVEMILTWGFYGKEPYQHL
jgi:hypothetical protein